MTFLLKFCYIKLNFHFNLISNEFELIDAPKRVAQFCLLVFKQLSNVSNNKTIKIKKNCMQYMRERKKEELQIKERFFWCKTKYTIKSEHGFIP